MKFFKLKFGENKEHEVRLSSVALLNLVESRRPIWHTCRHRYKKKKLANETKRECWRQIAKKMIGDLYLEAKVHDRLEIEQGLKARFHAMRDQWVKCRNRNKSYAFEEQIGFLSQRHFDHDDCTFYDYDGAEEDDNEHENGYEETTTNGKMIIMDEDDIKHMHSEEFNEIEHDSATIVDDNDLMTADDEEEHLHIELAQPTSTVYFEDHPDVVTEYPPNSPSPLSNHDEDTAQQQHPQQTSSSLLNQTQFLIHQMKNDPLQAMCNLHPNEFGSHFSQQLQSHSHTRSRSHHHRAQSPLSSQCGCHCHNDSESRKQMENYLFGKAIATLLNNIDGQKLFETKKAILSCIVKDIYVVDGSKK